MVTGNDSRLARFMIKRGLLFVLAFFVHFVGAFHWGRALAEGERDGGEGKMMARSDRLTEEEGRYLLGLARRTIREALFPDEKKPGEDAVPSKGLRERRGTFVTLTKEGGLRGCIGHITAQESVLEGVRENALNAAFRDPRFRPLDKDELKDIKIEVSILTEPTPLKYNDEKDLLAKLRPGIDGVIIKKGFRQATFLPQVWEQLPSKEDFLTHLCLKAGLQPDAWKKGDLQVLTYQVQAFEE